jgi:adenosylcobyric acid synthase
MYEDVSVNYIERPGEIDRPDVIILPGSKNTIEDLLFVRESGLEKKIVELHRQGTVLIGICGGYQMLGDCIEDPDSIEGDNKTINGLGIFNVNTVIAKDKITKQVKGTISASSGLFEGLKGSMISGYEIHMGISRGTCDELAVAETDNGIQGTFGNNAFGIYIHGIFDNMEFTRGLLNNIRKARGLAPVATAGTYSENKEYEFDRLAEVVRNNIDMKKIYSILYADNVSCC